MKILDIDGPLVTFLSKMADMMWLTILTMICCIPIVTIGASLTALNYVALRMARNEDGYVTRSFFKAFKENFKQATIIWLLFLVVFAFLFVDYRILTTTEVQVPGAVQWILLTFAVFVLFTFVFVWPVLAKFGNTVRRTILNAFAISAAQFPKTILMIFMYAVPFLLWYFVEPYISNIVPILFVFWLSVPAYLSAKLYDKFFRAMENKILAQQAENGEGDENTDEEDERIFKDEVDESLNIGQND